MWIRRRIAPACLHEKHINAAMQTSRPAPDLTRESIAITGGAGFVGVHLMARLLAHGFDASNLHVIHYEDYDLTREAEVQRMYDEIRPGVVIHLAAEVGGIGANRENPGRYFFANMSMGLHLIEGARIHGVKKFLQAGTICAYPKHTPVPFREDDLWNGYPEETNAPYGVAKKALLVMCQSYRQQYGLNAIYLLPVNLYGPHDNFNLQSSHVIPALIRKCVEARDAGATGLPVWGSGTVSREFLYVDDCAEGLVTALLKYDGAEPVNLGTGREITIRDLAELIARLTGFEGELVFDATQPDGQPRRCLDTSRAKKLFGFEANTSLEDGLRRTDEWYVANRDAPGTRN